MMWKKRKKEGDEVEEVGRRKVMRWNKSEE